MAKNPEQVMQNNEFGPARNLRWAQDVRRFQKPVPQPVNIFYILIFLYILNI